MKKILRRFLAAFCATAVLLTSASALSVEEAYEILRYAYVDKLPAEAKQAETLEELFSFTDAYTYYMSEEEYEAFLARVESEESFSGIGAEIRYTEEGILLVSLLSGGGAERAGLAAGDLITAVDGVSCLNAAAEHSALLRGDEGTKVRLRVLRGDGSEQEISVTRTRITLANTTVTAENGMGYIDCDSFGSQTGKYFQDGVKAYDKSVRAWVVDLRGNGGGLTSAAADALGVFCGEGTVASLVDRAGTARTEAYTGSDLTDKPVIALIDASSASASEIFALGVSGTGAGIVIGERSYGKGVAQVLFDGTNCPYLENDAVKVTSYRFYGANGCTSERIGVLPTLFIPQGYTTAAAKLLAGEKSTDGSARLRLVLNGCDFYVDAETEAREALRCILFALAPDAVVYWSENGAEVAITPAQAREKCGFAKEGVSFTDLSGHPYETEINALAAYRIVFGSDGAFRPDDTMTRAEVCALFAQAMNSSSAKSFFSDVAADAWYAESVNAMAEIGLVSGVGRGFFAPNDTMTQEEFLTVLGRFAEWLSLDARSYLDEHPLAVLRPLSQYREFSSWAVRGVDVLTNSVQDESGATVLMCWTELAEIEPQESITRAQAAASLYRVLRVTGALSY